MKPDIDMQAAMAFDAAYEAALGGLAEDATEPARTELAWTNAFRSAQLVSTPAEDLGNLAGQFGSRKISSDGQRLNYQRGGRAAWVMLGPVDGAYYFVESDRMRVRFSRTGSGAVELIEEFVDGFSRGFTR